MSCFSTSSSLLEGYSKSASCTDYDYIATTFICLSMVVDSIVMLFILVSMCEGFHNLVTSCCQHNRMSPVYMHAC